MKTFNWKEAESQYCEAAYYYLLHVHTKNIQEVDFIRGYTSLPHKHCYSNLCKNQKRAQKMYLKHKQTYGFFISNNWKETNL